MNNTIFSKIYVEFSVCHLKALSKMV